MAADLSQVIGGNGILHPKLKNRFRVIFRGADGKQIFQGVSLEIVTVSQIEQYDIDSGGVFEVEVEDDVTNHACDGLQSMMKNPGFETHIEYLAEDVAVRTHVLKGCRVERIIHDYLDYAGGKQDRTTLSFDNRNRRYDVENVPLEVQTVIEALKQLCFSVQGSNWEQGKQTKTVTLGYQSFEIK